jgi:hypothetical protein
MTAASQLESVYYIKLNQHQLSQSLERSARKSYAWVDSRQFINSSEGGFRFMPEVGDMAPDFELKSNLEKDKKVKLSDFRGKKNVVIAFYPLAWTPV